MWQSQDQYENEDEVWLNKEAVEVSKDEVEINITEVWLCKDEVWLNKDGLWIRVKYDYTRMRHEYTRYMDMRGWSMTKQGWGEEWLNKCEEWRNKCEVWLNKNDVWHSRDEIWLSLTETNLNSTHQLDEQELWSASDTPILSNICLNIKNTGLKQNQMNTKFTCLENSLPQIPPHSSSTSKHPWNKAFKNHFWNLFFFYNQVFIHIIWKNKTERERESTRWRSAKCVCLWGEGGLCLNCFVLHVIDMVLYLWLLWSKHAGKAHLFMWLWCAWQWLRYEYPSQTEAEKVAWRQKACMVLLKQGLVITLKIRFCFFSPLVCGSGVALKWFFI